MLVRFFVDYRIKPHVPPSEQIPANFIKFQPCDCTAQVGYSRRLLIAFINIKTIIPIVYSID